MFNEYATPIAKALFEMNNDVLYFVSVNYVFISADNIILSISVYSLLKHVDQPTRILKGGVCFIVIRYNYQPPNSNSY